VSVITQDIVPELEDLIKRISAKNTFYGNRIPASIMKMFTIEQTDRSAGILVPYWIPVLEHGRGKRKSNKDSGLVNRIYAWMEKRGMFTAGTPAGKLREAKAMTWYINKYGTKHFRSQIYIDIYNSERAQTITWINTKFALALGKITMNVI
jgi:hypothetical protein